ncbi:hypothetical protein [Streptomyces sporangiiformans]|uniref:Uncharacterized protein n=1 Tax=Streptomyces sporangiiformans TaxID=2315329 RepID=A0A505DF38_9ACTN|nr:hypothetical protein [Streptomyces sporangiiformans]TPQ17746.1 hypothetical protein FGD71_034310 [Streptomyces sporangiiformans]
MTSDNTQAVSTVRLRSNGAVDENTMTYARTKIDVVVSRPGMPSLTGEVRITRAAAHTGHKGKGRRAAGSCPRARGRRGRPLRGPSGPRRRPMAP